MGFHLVRCLCPGGGGGSGTMKGFFGKVGAFLSAGVVGLSDSTDRADEVGVLSKETSDASDTTDEDFDEGVDVGAVRAL